MRYFDKLQTLILHRHSRYNRKRTVILPEKYFHVSDQGNPTITCPHDIIQNANIVTWTNTATDTFDTEPNVVCIPSSGSSFTADQTTPVTCTATDDAQNTATCMFSATVGTFR